MERHDIVVVGAGPVGLSLALSLAHDGMDVLVLENEAGTAEHSRAPAIWPNSQEILAGLGVLDGLIETGTVMPHVELWDADRKRILLRPDIDELRDQTAYAQLLVVPQSKTERHLHEALRDTTPAEVRFDSEVVRLTQNGSGVDIHYRTPTQTQCVGARFAVGCDGAHSTVREQLGGTLEGITYDMRAALADIALTAGSDDFRFPRLTTRPRLSIAIRIDTRLWRLILPFSDTDKQQPLQARVEAATRSLFHGRAYDTVWQSEFDLHRRISTRWQQGRIALAGDAAHLNSPVGGEGMNAGFADADLLRKALGKALASDNEQPLKDYVRQRSHAIERGQSLHGSADTDAADGRRAFDQPRNQRREYDAQHRTFAPARVAPSGHAGRCVTKAS